MFARVESKLLAISHAVHKRPQHKLPAYLGENRDTIPLAVMSTKKGSPDALNSRNGERGPYPIAFIGPSAIQSFYVCDSFDIHLCRQYDCVRASEAPKA